MVAWGRGGVVAWWRGGVVAWGRGGVVAWWRGGVVAWWRGGVRAWWRGCTFMTPHKPFKTLDFDLNWGSLDMEKPLGIW